MSATEAVNLRCESEYKPTAAAAIPMKQTGKKIGIKTNPAPSAFCSPVIEGIVAYACIQAEKPSKLMKKQTMEMMPAALE